MFKNIDALQKGAAGAGKKKSGGMKEAADAAEQIRKWVSQSIMKLESGIYFYVMPDFYTSFVSDAISGVNGDNALFANFIRGRF